MRTRRIAQAAPLAALAIALALVPSAFAGKGGGGGSPTPTASSLSLVMVTDNNGDGLPNWGDEVTFNVSTSASYPMVELDCWQGSNQVDSQKVGFYPGWPWSRTFPLSHWYYWPSGGADCTATLYYQAKRGNVTLATKSFRTND